MKITSITLRMIDHDNALRAIVSILLDDMLVIHDIKLIEKDHMFIAMPSKKVNGCFVNIAHPINQQTRSSLEKLLCDAYDLSYSYDQYVIFKLKNDHDLFHVSIDDYMIEKEVDDIDEVI